MPVLEPDEVFVPRHAPALRAIIFYKLGRAVVSLLGSVTALVLGLGGLDVPVSEYAMAVHDHAVSALALQASELLVSAVQPGHILVLSGALFLDGVVLAVEGYTLHRGWTWGVWLVVGTAAVLLPFEGVALVHKPAIGRVLILLINGVIVTWLLRHAMHKSRAPRPP